MATNLVAIGTSGLETSQHGKTVLMLPDLAPGAKYSTDLSKALTDLATDADNVRTGGHVHSFIEKYLQFCNSAARRLTWQLTSDEIERLLLTATYWHIQTMGVAPDVHDLIDRELTICVERLKASAKSVRTAVEMWPYCVNVIVPDTNILVHGLSGTIGGCNWPDLAGVTPHHAAVVVLLQAVIGELDKHKRSTKKDARTQARRLLREIDGHLDQLLGSGVKLQTAASLPDGRVACADVTLLVVTDSIHHQRLADTDAEIIDRTLALGGRSDAKVTCLTGDTGAALRAKAAGLTVHKAPTPDPEAA
jgi:hypothetical protein